MKQRLHFNEFLLSLLFLLLISSHYPTRATRLLTPKQGKEKTKFDGLSQLDHSRGIEEYPLNMLDLEGLEDCESGDEECLKRRMMSEAHLDYIYTQHRKP